MWNFFIVRWWGIGNKTIFSASTSLSVHIDNKKYILILGKGPTQGLDDTA